MMKSLTLFAIVALLAAGCAKPDYAMIQQMHTATMQSNTAIANALANGENTEALETVELDLEQFEPTDPGVTLADVLAALGGEAG